MADWLSGIGSKIGSLFGSRTPSTHLGVFGKHPGWNDHLDDVGLDTEPLIATKQYLYVQGIGGIVDAGLWEALPDGDVLPEFGHTFVWTDADNILVGKLWSSSDGKGRTKFPMVVCSHFANRREATIPDIVPLLNQLEQSFRATNSADDVLRLVAEATGATALLINSHAIQSQSRTAYAEGIGIKPDSEAAARIAYFAENHFGALARSGASSGRINLKLGQQAGQPQHIRVPAQAADPLATLQFWRAFLSATIPSGTPQLYLAPAGSPWLDVIVGLPTAKHLVCLRAGPNAVPLASEIPYDLTAESRSKAVKCWQDFLATA